MACVMPKNKMAFQSESISQNETFTMEEYETHLKQCQQNNLESCVTFAIWTRDYMESPAEAYLPLKKACDGNHMKGCNVLANLYLNQYSGLGMDYDQAKSLYEKSCQGGYKNACDNLEELKKEIKNQTIKKETKAEKQERLSQLYQSCMMENIEACSALEIEMRRQKLQGNQ